MDKTKRLDRLSVNFSEDASNRLNQLPYFEFMNENAKCVLSRLGDLFSSEHRKNAINKTAKIRKLSNHTYLPAISDVVYASNDWPQAMRPYFTNNELRSVEISLKLRITADMEEDGQLHHPNDKEEVFLPRSTDSNGNLIRKENAVSTMWTSNLGKSITLQKSYQIYTGISPQQYSVLFPRRYMRPSLSSPTDLASILSGAALSETDRNTRKGSMFHFKPVHHQFEFFEDRFVSESEDLTMPHMVQHNVKMQKHSLRRLAMLHSSESEEKTLKKAISNNDISTMFESLDGTQSEGTGWGRNYNGQSKEDSHSPIRAQNQKIRSRKNPLLVKTANSVYLGDGGGER
ncbi:hypothetical protein AB6A40_009808 [Gnathostoma spinigerum]|uniref:Uncharacterized protein n=1 Tax=Gnathostoma spinigerum TaxID=75299 RepID=A0ABD6ET04_9BILA